MSSFICWCHVFLGRPRRLVLGIASSITLRVTLVALANNLCEGNIEALANRLNEFLVSVSNNLPRLTDDLAVCDVQDEIPAE